jgi:hypothetical protein
MKPSIPIGQEFLIGPKAFTEGSKTKTNHDLVYIASFWREHQLVQTKKQFKGELMVWRTKI